MPEKKAIDAASAEAVRNALDLKAFFPDLSAEVLVESFPSSGLYVYEPRSYVLEQGEASKDVYVVVNGLITITQATPDGRTMKLGTLEAGSVFGEMALVKDGARVASALAGEDTVIFRLAFSDVESLVRQHPGLAEHLSKLASSRA